MIVMQITFREVPGDMVDVGVAVNALRETAKEQEIYELVNSFLAEALKDRAMKDARSEDVIIPFPERYHEDR